MSGVFGQVLGRKVLAPRALAELGEVGRQFLPAVAPGEVGVALAEADLGQPVHHARSREGFGQEDHVGEAAAHVRDAPFPEREGLGVRVVDAKDAHALPGPVLEDACQRSPKAAPVAAFEVERVDVLVLLGRVLGVLHAAVGALAEPIGMCAHPGVVRRALEGDVQGQLDALGLRLGQQALEVSQRAQRTEDGVVPAFGRPTAQGLPTSSIPGVQGVVGPLRRCRPTGWMGGKYSTSKPICRT
jgi:hypothetical protein